MQIPHPKEWELTQDDESIERTEKINYVIETESVQNEIAGLEFDPKSLPLDNAIQEKALH
jgi:hypothetical protein